jgi:hypothetical protein
MRINIMKMVLITTVIALFVGSPASQAAAQEPIDKQKIALALLTTPDKCAVPCLWTLQPNKSTMGELQQFMQGVLLPAEGTVTDKGTTVAYYGHGVALHVGNSGNNAEPSAPVFSFFVRLIVSQSKAAGIRIDDFTPAAMVSSLGTPTAAHLLYSKAQLGKSNRFRLVLLFEARAAVYVISGQARDERVCLAPDDLEVLTLYRFRTEDIAGIRVGNFAGGEALATTALREMTRHTEQDLLALAKSPDRFCLSLR